MLTEVEVLTSQGNLLTMVLDDVSDGIVVQNIDGLDPVKATIVTSSFANLDGTQYHASRREDRNIKLRLGLEPDWELDTVESVRKRVYNYFMPKMPLAFTFRTSEGLDVDISGRVESCESALFTAEPAMDISVICFDSDFVDPEAIIVPGNTVDDTTNIDITYDGSVETGITFTLNIDRTLTEFTIYSVSADGIIRQMDFAGEMAAGDDLTIVTIPGQKSAMISSGGSPTSILYGVSPQANWIEFQPGLNTFRVYAEGAPIPYTVTYNNRYGGL